MGRPERELGPRGAAKRRQPRAWRSIPRESWPSPILLCLVAGAALAQSNMVDGHARPRRAIADEPQAAAARQSREQGRPPRARVFDAAADDPAQDRQLPGRPERQRVSRLPQPGDARRADAGGCRERQPLHGPRRQFPRRDLAAALLLRAMPRRRRSTPSRWSRTASRTSTRSSARHGQARRELRRRRSSA